MSEIFTIKFALIKIYLMLLSGSCKYEEIDNFYIEVSGLMWKIIWSFNINNAKRVHYMEDQMADKQEVQLSAD